MPASHLILCRPLLLLPLIFPSIRVFPNGLVVKNLPAMQETKETWVQSLGVEYPLEEEMETHSSILAQRIPWTEKLGRLQFKGPQGIRHD